MISTLFLHGVGYSVFFGLLYAICKSNARRWNRLAQVYRAEHDLLTTTFEAHPERSMQTVFLAGGDVGWNSYKGIVSVAITSQGILLKLMRPFSLFHPPLLIPLRDIHFEPTRWYLMGKTSQLTFRHVSNVQMIVHDDLVHWITSQLSQIAIETH